eukprot:336529-Rhodomonas_salina.1
MYPGYRVPVPGYQRPEARLPEPEPVPGHCQGPLPLSTLNTVTTLYPSLFGPSTSPSEKPLATARACAEVNPLVASRDGYGSHVVFTSASSPCSYGEWEFACMEELTLGVEKLSFQIAEVLVSSPFSQPGCPSEVPPQAPHFLVQVV